jgi:hypothetical protein
MTEKKSKKKKEKCVFFFFFFYHYSKFSALGLAPNLIRDSAIIKEFLISLEKI